MHHTTKMSKYQRKKRKRILGLRWTTIVNILVILVLPGVGLKTLINEDYKAKNKLIRDLAPESINVTDTKGNVLNINHRQWYFIGYADTGTRPSSGGYAVNLVAIAEDNGTYWAMVTSAGYRASETFITYTDVPNKNMCTKIREIFKEDVEELRKESKAGYHTSEILNQDMCNGNNNKFWETKYKWQWNALHLKRSAEKLLRVER